jgi:two-component system phosphate regulon sensor histidine kinase PhoR
LKGAKALSDNASTIFSRLFGQMRRAPTPKPSLPQRDKERLLMQANDRLKTLVRERDRDLERFRATFDALDELACLLDMGGAVVYLNRSARELFGTPEEFLYSRAGQVTLAVAPEAAEMTLTPAQRVEFQDRTLALQVAVVSDGQGRAVGRLALMRDVTDSQVSQRLRSHFIRSISHELKTPLAKIKGTADLLGARASQNPPMQQMVESLIDHVDVLDRMVVEMLDLAEMGGGTFMVSREQVQVEPVIGAVVRGLLPEVQKHGLEVLLMIRDAERLMVAGDEQRLRWALGHLLRNSIQYTENKGSIVVVAGLDEDDSALLTIDVIDSGVGIADDDLPRIFERFYRGRPVTREGVRLDPRGLGQGLYIARGVAEAHGGRLDVRTTVGEGSVFTLTLPVWAGTPD